MKFFIKKNLKYVILILAIVIIAVISYTAVYYANQTSFLQNNEVQLFSDLSIAQKVLKKIESELQDLKNQDQYLINKQLEKDIKEIEKTYQESVSAYEDLVKLKETTSKTQKFDQAYVDVLNLLVKRNYSSAEAKLAAFKSDLQKEKDKIASSFSVPQNVTASNQPPASGYKRQKVASEVGEFMVDIISADLNSTRVVVDTASDGTCGNDCPVASLADFSARSGAYAAINGPYFCPAAYPSCAGKTNSFDTLMMNKNKVYFNSDNNVYSVVPAVIFSGNGAKFVTRSLEWGRDTGVDAVIASQPLLVFNGEVVYGGDSEVKRSGKGSRSFIGATGNMVYIGVVHNANVAEVARVLKALGIQNALNLDSGGSTALWNGRYIVGPGRSLPFGILFVRK